MDQYPAAVVVSAAIEVDLRERRDWISRKAPLKLARRAECVPALFALGPLSMMSGVLALQVGPIQSG